MYLLGFDIGGTKCAVSTARCEGSSLEILEKRKCPTEKISPYKMIEKLISMADSILESKPDKIGISCGGPLDSKKGLILSPPNLLGWDNIEIVKTIQEHYNVTVFLQNDANACAVAEWKFGAGVGKNNLVFLTFGTGLGAGIILDGKLYSGTNDNAGEVGHIRLDNYGPVGFGKTGSFEGFCSGGGIAQLGKIKALEKKQMGEVPMYCNGEEITAKSIAEAADKGDKTALEVFEISGRYLGKGLSIIIDILNPEMIIIGSVFARSKHLLLNSALKEIERESLASSAKCCKIVPAKLGERIGDYAALSVATIGG